MGVDTAMAMAISGENTVRLGTIDNVKELQPMVASNTESGTVRKCGIDDWKSVSMGYGYEPAVFPGDSFTFTLSLDGTNGYTGTGYCEQIDIIIDVENGKYIENAIHASRNGTMTPGAAAATDTTEPNPPCPQSLSVKLGGTAQDDVRYMHLMMRCPGVKYVSSDTAGGRQRKRGAMDAQLTYRVYNIDPAGLPTKGTAYVVGVMVSDALTWELKWMRCERVKQIADTESGEPVGAEITMKFNSHDGTSAGWIKNPSLSTKWPFA